MQAEPLATRRGLLAMAVFGAVVGSVLDGLHTYSGTTTYTSPCWLKAAWWTPVIFAVGYPLDGVLYRIATRDRAPMSVDRALRCLAVFTVLYALSGFLPASNPVKLGVLTLGGAGLWWYAGALPKTLLVSVAAAVIGPGTEIALTHFGVFRHLQPDFWGIPMWLPMLYVASAPGVGPILGWLGRRWTASG